jgi:hypothetical protein
MLYAILAYHEESAITSLTPEEDAKLMGELLKTHEVIDAEDGTLGPAARLDFSSRAVTLRGKEPLVIDGPFAETKEHLLGFYTIECESLEEAINAARRLRRVNSSAVYEIRPILFYQAGKPLSAGAEDGSA